MSNQHVPGSPVDVTAWLNGPCPAKANVEQSKAELAKQKGRIDEYRKQGLGQRFEHAARNVNPYEHVASVAVPSISRAHFKLAEMAHRFPLLKGNAQLCACLCEGPGGFAEFVQKSKPDWSLSCITLLNQGPQMDVALDCVWRGGDGTGNILNVANIAEYVDYLQGKGGCALITADGGFDADPAEQEKASMPLFYAQTLVAMRALKQGGCFVLKLFDTWEQESCALLNTLAQSFESVHLYKPLTSRVCNSEKYVVACGFTAVKSEPMSNDFISHWQSYCCWYARFQTASLEAAHTNAANRKLVEPKEKAETRARAFCQEHGIPLRAPQT